MRGKEGAGEGGGGERHRERGAYVLVQVVLVGSATSFLSSPMPEARISEVRSAESVAWTGK